jgi:hypothetical protein
MLPGSPDYLQTRNDVYKTLREKSYKIKVETDEFTAIDLSSIYILLIGVPERIESYECLHIL